MKRPESRLFKDDWDDEHGLPDDTDTDLIELDEEDDATAPAVALTAGWRALMQEPGLMLWSIFATLIGGVLRWIPWFILIIALIGRPGQIGIESPETLLAWGLGSIDWLLNPRLLMGVVGMLVAVGAGVWALGVAVDSGVLGALEKRLESEKPLRGGLFWKALGERFLGLMAWEALRTALVGGLLLLTVMLCLTGWSKIGGLMMEGSTLHLVAGAFVLAGFASVGLALSALAAVWTHLALGPLIGEGLGLGDALVSSWSMMRRRWVEISGLYVVIGLVFVAVWGVYLPYYGISLLMGADEGMSVAGSMMQLMLELASVCVMALVTIWTRAGVLSYAAIRRGALERLPGELSDEDEASPEEGDGSDTPGLDDLLPSKTANIVDYEAVRKVALGQGQDADGQ